MAIDLAEKKARRAAFMKHLHDITDGNSLVGVTYYEFTRDLFRWTDAEADSVANCLDAEGLVEIDFGGAVSIAHPGVIEVEKLLERPEQPTTTSLP